MITFCCQSSTPVLNIKLGNAVVTSLTNEEKKNQHKLSQKNTPKTN